MALFMDVHSLSGGVAMDDVAKAIRLISRLKARTA